MLPTREPSTEKQPHRSGRLRAYLLLAVCVAYLLVRNAPLLRAPAVPNDFAIYWAAGKKVLAGGNPYAHGHELLQQQIRFREPEPLVLRNPPWTLPLLLPFSLVDFSPAQKLWLGCGLLAVLVSDYWLAELYGSPPRRILGWLAAAAFLPIAVVLAIGQIGPWLLLGIAGFLHYEAQGKYAWAGAFLFLLSVKPHLALTFWVALALFVFLHQQWRIALGFLAVLAMMSAIALVVHPAVFREYAQLWGANAGFVAEVNPTLGGLCGLLLHAQWGQFVPAILSLIWLAYYWRRHTRAWSWKDHAPMLLMVSMLVTWYGWFFDQVVLVPCVLQAVFSALSLSARARFLYAIVYLGINVIVLALILNHRTTFWYTWTMPAWLLLYWSILRTSRSGKQVVGAS